MTSHNIKINPLSKMIEKSTLIINSDNTISVKLGINSKYTNLTFSNSSLYLDNKNKYKEKPLFEIPKDEIKYDDNILFLCKEGNYERHKELLYLVLDCLFSSNHDFYIKKCELCNKYYFTIRANKQYCERKRITCNVETTCQGSLNVLDQSKEYMAIRRLKTRHWDTYYKKADYEYINKFVEKYNSIIDKCKEKRDITNKDIDDITKLTLPG